MHILDVSFPAHSTASSGVAESIEDLPLRESCVKLRALGREYTAELSVKVGVIANRVAVTDSHLRVLAHFWFPTNGTISREGGGTSLCQLAGIAWGKLEGAYRRIDLRVVEGMKVVVVERIVDLSCSAVWKSHLHLLVTQCSWKYRRGCRKTMRSATYHSLY